MTGRSETVPLATEASGPGRRGRTLRSRSLAAREAAWGWTFVSPWIVGFVLFTVIPMAIAFWFSLTDFDLRKPNEAQFVGLRNYIRLLGDPNVTQSVLVTLRFAAITI